MALDGIKCPYYEYFRRCHSELNPRKKLSESCKGSDMPDYRNCPFFGSGQILQSNIGKYCGKCGAQIPQGNNFCGGCGAKA